MKSSFLLSLVLPAALLAQQRVRVGTEILLEKHLDLLLKKNVGVLCNQTSILPNKTHLVDTLLARGVRITALFSPEHGIRGDVPRGVLVHDSLDKKTGLPIFSLYGPSKKPTPHMLEKVDVLVFDLQDVGARFYTFYITMSNAMQAAAENGKEFVVLDRPNPINGNDVEGPILDSTLQSAVGRFPVPIRHGLTLGELAKMIVGERWIDSAFKLTVIPMEGWNREMWFDDTNLPWVPPSPNMKFLSTAIVYPGTCLFEGTNLSEGRGTFKPFEYIGAPWLDARKLATTLNNLRLPGVRFHSIRFIPEEDRRESEPKYDREDCRGVFLEVKDRKTFQPISTAVHMIAAIRSLHSSQFKFHDTLFDRLSGSASLRKGLDGKIPADSLITSWISGLEGFLKLRSQYLIY